VEHCWALSNKQNFKKDNGVFFYHYVQSFSPKENVTPQMANKIGLRLAKQFEGFEVLIATHVDAGHIHNHLIVNSVSHQTGKKLRQHPTSLMEHRAKSDESQIYPTASVASDAVQLGKNLENILNSPQPTRPYMHTDSKQKQREKLKKLAQGHKLPSEEQEETQDWNQNM